MNITQDVINDLYPLYVENECSADTRALVEDYLRRHPQHAEELRRALSVPLPGAVPPARDLGETQALREARRRVRLRSWLMGFAIFFSVAPLSVISIDGHIWWFLRDATGTALIYAAVGVVFWILYAVQGRRLNSL
jgi:ferric-dicitrate binding protein FerR (iron transport regulator)